MFVANLNSVFSRTDIEQYKSLFLIDTHSFDLVIHWGTICTNDICNMYNLH